MATAKTLSYGPATITVETITPEMASEILATKNVKNRALKKGFIKTLAANMVEGRFNLQGDPIKFDADGTLLDGQNRLAAVEAAGVPVLFIVIRGIDNKAQVTMDSGSKRTAADNLRIAGHGRDSTVLAAAVRGIYLYEKSGRQPTNLGSSVANNDSNDFLERNRRIESGLDTIKALSKVNGLKAKANAATIWWAISEVGGEKADEFFEALITGANLEADSPILMLRNTLDRLGSAKNGNRSQSVVPVAITFKAWNAWLEGKTPSRLWLRETGKRREAFPQPIAPSDVAGREAA